MLAAAAVFFFVWSVPVWLPVLLGLLWPGLRAGVRLAFIGSGAVCGLFVSLGAEGGEAVAMERLLRLPLPAMALCAWLLTGGVCLATAHHFIRENNATAPRCVASLLFLLLHLPLGVLCLYPWLERSCLPG